MYQNTILSNGKGDGRGTCHAIPPFPSHTLKIVYGYALVISH